MSGYKEILVYKNVDDSVYLYVCLEDLESGLYCVHQMEIIDEARLPEAMREVRFNLLDALLSEDPRCRCDWAQSLEAAINRHDEEFEDPR